MVISGRALQSLESHIHRQSTNVHSTVKRSIFGLTTTTFQTRRTMPSYAATVKWGKESLSISLDPSAGPTGLKQQLSALTNVLPERMKIMSKSKNLWKSLLKDDTDLTVFSFESPVQLLLMGSAEKLPEKPSVKTVFIEDLPPEEKARVVR